MTTVTPEDKVQKRRDYMTRYKAEHGDEMRKKARNRYTEYKKSKEVLKKERLAAGICYVCGKNPVAKCINDSRRDKIQYCEECRIRYKEKYLKRGGYVPERDREADRRWREQNVEKAREKERRARLNLKKEVVRHYGGICACCGEREIEFLTIDHINGGGTAERIKIFGHEVGGVSYYRWLKKNGYPTHVQVLCYNCNMAKSNYGMCPHKRPYIRTA